MKVWITKNALSSGIVAIQAAVPCDGLEWGSVEDLATKKKYSKKDWHRTRAEAVARANQMRLSKIQTLKSQLAKLEKLYFR